MDFSNVPKLTEIWRKFYEENNFTRISVKQISEENEEIFEIYVLEKSRKSEWRGKGATGVTKRILSQKIWWKNNNAKIETYAV